MADAVAGAVRILLVEDSDIDAELLAGHLQKAEMRFHIDRVITRGEFVAALKRGRVDIILADYALPEFDGLSALMLAREMTPDLPFLFVSGVVGEEFATSAIKRGATDYVLKRNLSRLPTAIVRALSEARERAERKLAEEAVIKLNETLEAEVEARTRERDRIWRLGRDLFAVMDGDGRLLAVNPAWWRVLAYDEADLISRPFESLSHPDDVPAVRAMLEVLRGGQPVERFEGRLHLKDDGWRWIAWTVTPEDRIFYAVGRDITTEKQAQAELALANSSLKAEISERERVEATLRQMQRLEAIGQLTSGVAHDFNNLLSVVLGSVGFLERKTASQIDEKSRQRLGNIRLAAERGAKLTAQLLAFSRRQRLEPKAVNLNDTVASMRDLLQSTIGGSVRLETVLNPDLWPALVDPTQIEMIILNLAINARDAMGVGGGLTVETANVTLRHPQKPEEPAAGEYVALIVSDTGSGMTPEVLAKAFEPFFTTKGPGRGSGLGLAQVYGFAKQSGGGVGIDTAVGKGTSIKVYLPRAAAITADIGDEQPAAPDHAVHGQTILIVDDDVAVREVTASLLTELGYQVIEAGSGKAGLDLLGKIAVDLLLADYAMPDMNGVETAAAAKELQPDLPVLFLTGYADLAALEGMGEEGVLQKPFQDNELGQKVAALLSRARPGPAKGKAARPV